MDNLFKKVGTYLLSSQYFSEKITESYFASFGDYYKIQRSVEKEVMDRCHQFVNRFDLDDNECVLLPRKEIYGNS